MDAVSAGAEIHGARAKRIAGASRHETRQIRLACNHFCRGIPIRPFRLAADGLHAGPGETFAADADAVTNRPAPADDVIEPGVTGIDDDSAGALPGAEGNRGA